MRLIQNKLSTPTSSMENLNQYNKYKNSSYAKPEVKRDAISSKSLQEPQSVTNLTSKTTPIIIQEAINTEKSVPPPKPATTTITTFADTLPPKEEAPKPAEKIYKYRGPPSISVSTWSERPKVPVNIKEDSDYKLSNHNVNSKLLVSTTNNDITSNNSVEVRNNFNNNQDTRGVSIKVNGTESINQQGSNVVIKIGDARSKPIDNQRFINHTTAAGYRKPFSSISSNQGTQRPHSIAFDSDFDISRVPVVRSFELKKPYKDMANTSVTQIYHEEDKIRANTLGRTNGNSEVAYRYAGIQNRQREPEETPELARRFATMNNRNSYADVKDSKPVFRVSSFKPVAAAPVVRGFKQNNEVNNKRMTWNGSNIYKTLPAKPKEVDNNNCSNGVAFSQSNLRRTESNKMMEKNESTNNNNFNSLPSIQQPEVKAPPPPLMPKIQPVRKPIEPVVDQRDQLLSAIRNFGGKKGLKAVKV